MSRNTRFSTILAAAALLAAAAVLVMMVGSDRGVPGGDVAYAQETCGAAVADRSNTGLVSDCNTLLAARDVLRGAAALNWAPNTPISRWNGITLGGSPQRVTKIKLQKRGLNGHIPAMIGRLDALQELWLYNNDLSSSIPTEMGDLFDLRWLFISDNNLSGQIPETLNRLALDRLWLQDNDFTGCVPYNLTLTREYKVDSGLATCAPPGDPIQMSSRIAFDSNRDGNYEIYVMNADGSGQTRLTNNPAVDSGPSLSPDGRRIAFASSRDGNYEIYVMNVDGSGQTRLTDNPANDGFLNWSPDGRRIAFNSYRDGNSEIYVMNADGSGQTRLTRNSAYDNLPSWSPDGRRIVFESTRDGTVEIYVMNADGSGQTRLTYNSDYDRHPSWSPDGRRIAFVVSYLGGGGGGIHVMNADGSGRTRLTNLADDRHPSWSPDGRRIAFESYRDGNRDIYVMNADGSGRTRLTRNSAQDSYPSWSIQSDPGPVPTTSRIAFASFRDGHYEIYVMNADGSDQIRLAEDTSMSTNINAYDYGPSWSPDGRRIAFVSTRVGHYEIYVMNADGSDQTRLTNSSDTGYLAFESDPSWSPDGRRIAFASFRDPIKAYSSGFIISEIYVMNVDGSGQTRLTYDPADDQHPSWSPDGRRIAFQSSRDDPDPSDGSFIYNIYVMNMDGSGQTRLTNNPASDGDPSWSPDGRRIAFASDRDGNDEIYVMNADGSGQTRLTNNLASDGDPSWSPDGRRIVFQSNRDGNDEIYVMNADGSGQTRLTYNPANDRHPSWSTRGGPGNATPTPTPTPTPVPTAVPTPTSTPTPTPVPTLTPPASDDVMKRIHCRSDDFAAAFGDRFAATYNVSDEGVAASYYSRNGRGLWATLTTRWVSSSDPNTSVVCRTKVYDNISSAALDNQYATMVEEASGHWDVLRRHKLCCEEIGQSYRGLLLDIGRSASVGDTVQWRDTVSQRVAVSAFRWNQVIVQVAVYHDDAYHHEAADAMARRVESRFDDTIFDQIETRRQSSPNGTRASTPPSEDSLHLAPQKASP